MEGEKSDQKTVQRNGKENRKIQAFWHFGFSDNLVNIISFTEVVKQIFKKFRAGISSIHSFHIILCVYTGRFKRKII